MMKNTKVVSFSKPTRKKGPQYGRLTWKVFKVFVLILCIAGFVYQTTEFYAHFRTYPTTTSIEIITPDEFTAPAITFCNKNSIQRRRFCNENPDRCFTMTNITKFCNDHPHYCRDNPSSLVIPHLFPYSNVRIAVTDEDVKKYSQGSWEFSRVSRGGKEQKPFYVDDWRSSTIKKCYAQNSLFNTKYDKFSINIADKMNGVGSNYKVHFKQIMMNADSHENFFPFEDPGVLISVHSPFVPVNPFEEGTFLRPGYRYEIFIEMEQERLLPYPYQTDCIDYDVRFQTNNKTGPRSQRQCLDRCWSNYSRQMYGCEESLTIYETLDTKCKEDPLGDKEKNEKYWPGLLKCKSNCKPDCLKLKYSFSVRERTNDYFSAIGPQFKARDDTIRLEVYVRNPEVMVLSHNPLYVSVELFGYIGGLMGCWLGISVWAFIDILEGPIWNLIKLLRKKTRSNEK